MEDGLQLCVVIETLEKGYCTAVIAHSRYLEEDIFKVVCQLEVS